MLPYCSGICYDAFVILTTDSCKIIVMTLSDVLIIDDRLMMVIMTVSSARGWPVYDDHS